MNGARNSYSVRSKGAIYTLLFFAILCAVAMFVCSSLFYYYEVYFHLDTYALITAILIILAAVFFIVSLACRKGSAVLATIAFALTACSFIPKIVQYISIDIPFSNQSFFLIKYLPLLPAFAYVLFFSLIAMAVLFGVSVISSLSGFNKKALAIITGVFGIIFSIGIPVYYIFSSKIYNLFVQKSENIGYYLFPLIAAFMLFLAWFFISCAVLTHAIKNRVPPANGGARYYAPVQAADYVPSNDPDSPEAKLAALSAKLEFGIITKEEYDAQRAEIINNI